MTRARATALILSGLAAVALIAFALQPRSPAAAATELQLDSYRANNGPATTTGPVLDNGVQYNVSITGTFSYWPASQWEDNGVCAGESEDMPMFPSPGTTNGQVGVDSAWHFAAPGDAGDCASSYPRIAHIEISLDGGATNPEYEADDVGAAPNPDHVYHYALVGHGHAVVFSIADNKTTDNYGILKISIEATASPTATPLHKTVKWGDNNCDGDITVDDAMRGLAYLAALEDATGVADCPDIGETVDFVDAHPAGAGTLTWGDVYCIDGLNGIDVLVVLHYIAGAQTIPFTAGFCPDVGDEVVFDRH